MEIQAFVAKHERFYHVEKLLEEWEEAVHEGTVSGDEKSPLVKLARERIEIEQQIANLQDHKNR